MYRFFENLVDPFTNVPTGTPPATLLAYMKTQIAPFRHLVPWIALSGLLVALVEGGLIWYGGRLIDMMNGAGPAGFWAAHGTEALLVAAGILFLRPAFIGLNSLLLGQTLSSNLSEQARWRAHKHMLGQSASFFQNDFAGRLANRVMQMGPAVEDSIFMMFEALWFAASYMLGAALILGDVHPALLIPLALWLVAYLAYTRWIAVRTADASERHSDARSLATGRVVDAYANIETVKLFAHGAREEDYALSAMKRVRLRFQRFLRLMTLMTFGLNVLNGLLIVGVIAPAVWLWANGAATVGQVTAAIALTIRLNGMSGWIMWVAIRLFEHAGVIREGLRSIAIAHSVIDRPAAPALALKRGEVRFEGVSHHYGKGAGGLDNVSLTIPAGQKVGLVGRSGAGKSSLVNLLLRFRDVEHGRILIDGQPVGAVTQDSLRGMIGMVTQDSSLLHRSVRANILYGRPGATEAEMMRAAERAEAHHFIDTLTDPEGRRGYDAQVGERGVKLSGGQRQRIALARVILKDAPILILDEATSALDSEVEEAIQSSLYGVMEGKTVIAIAHRLSTIARMDRIVVLDRGRVAEDGTHDALLARGGIYAGLWSRQSGGFLGAEDDVA
ncbi:multidrug ABC transporter ATP-binding protein [Oceanicola sp. 22II-s10i]|uniref:ABC transporter ATP-binding protein n=1 Tax=Oceanicola sp. 22II-s10i TaxID=1317116 RepID=UPI000B523D9F|nr:ABC transporter ATP-binding protein [Oceanicola sp. 22II-s10i]OWU82944.1 multidrug ABC transporter ATP-binding protein [Oceanicola sp. 22II-s10i]